MGGDWYFAPVVRHTGAVYLNDRQLYETETLEECIKGEVYLPSWDHDFSVYKWYTEQAGDTTVIYANFQGHNPNEEKKWISMCAATALCPQKQEWIILPSVALTLTKLPQPGRLPPLIRTEWSALTGQKGWIIEDCEISNSKCCGISLGKYYDPENDHYFTNKHVKSPTQMERDAVCRGQYHGWLKEK